MPHQCTECGRTFEDGSKEMLSGCPGCDGNKFQFIPKGAMDDADGSPSQPDDSASPPDRPSRDGNAVTKAATTVREWVNRNSEDEDRAWPKSATEDYDTPAEKAAARSDESPARADDSPTGPAESGTQPTESTAGTSDPAAGETQPSNAAETAEPEAAEPTPAETTGPKRAEAAESDTAEPDTAESRPAPQSADDQEGAGSISARTMSSEDNAQASARSDIVSPDELPDPGEQSSAASGAEPAAQPAQSGAPEQQVGSADGHVVAEPADTEVDDRPDLDELREELNQQFESIKILNPGQYELNLMELYDREEYIISLREDGRYVIDVPDSWRGEE
ncbi:OapC/ArvC family zinc-ribbon domain-containing protein [Haloarchaeobius amylolyticus]|uniref:OapC/ArvC family zinc-ribbon domain-containing protein n=1 Tax=Haloarchaeobius amylolyticus TaxID=1198296 RepID=UPI00226D94C8|nr:Zn-ribbon containing protein [Haloarchaeobius amylolyticus]